MYELLTTPILDKAQWKSRLHGPPPGLSNLYFTDKWPGTTEQWLSGKYFQINQTAIVEYPYGSAGLPGDDYEWFDMENANYAPSGFTALSLYPNSANIAYEILIGMKPGNYQAALYIPGTSDYLLALGYPSQHPDITSSTLKYLGSFRPEDSPWENPQIKVWTVYQMTTLLLQIYADNGQDYEKPILKFTVAKHRLSALQQPPAVYDTIRYYTEFRGSW